MRPRSAIPIKRSVLVSSRVDLVPSLAATRACTSGFSCSASALNSSSFLAKASVSLPVVGLIFVGGVTPRLVSVSANWGLLISVALSTVTLDISSSFFFLTFVRCSSSTGLSSTSTGSEYILIVRSISRISMCGNPSVKHFDKLYVRSTSLMQ